MPTYRIETNQGTFEIDANREPTAEEIRQYVSTQHGQPASPEDPEKLRLMEQYAEGLRKGDYGAAGHAAEQIKDPGMYSRRGGLERAGQSMALEGGGAALGQSIGLLGGPFAGVTVPAGGAIGATIGNVMDQRSRIKLGEQDGYSFGEMGGAAVGGLIPGGSEVRAGLRPIIREGVKQGVGGVAAKTLQTGIDEGRAPTKEEIMAAGGLAALGGGAAQKMHAGTAEAEAARAAVAATMARNAPRDTALKAGREMGLAVKPTSVNPESNINKALESLAGRGALSDSLKIKNEAGIDAAARREAGLAADADLTSENLSAARQGMTGPYKELEAMHGTAGEVKDAVQKQQTGYHDFEIATDKLGDINKQAAADIKELNSVRSHAAGLHRQNNTQYNYDVAQKAAALDEQAALLEDRIAGAATSAGKPELIEQLRAARTAYAKNYDVERSLNQLTGHVNAQKLGQMAQKSPGKLTGELADIAAFQKNFPDTVGTGKSIQDPGSTGTNMTLPLLAAGGKVAAGNPGAAIGAGIPLMRGPARAVLMSKAYQKRFANPRYVPEVNPELEMTIIREMLKAKGRQ